MSQVSVSLGDPRAPERFWKFVTVVDCSYSTPCWLFKLHVGGSNGYKMFSVGKRGILAHRYAYELLVEPIRPNLTIDHLCRERACCNPAHLEQVTHAENNARSNGPSAVNSRRTQCVNGHPYDSGNTYIRRGGSRACRACMRDRVNRKSAERRAQRIAAVTYKAPGWNGNADKTHCPQGHPYSADNTIVKPQKSGGTGRMCRECNRAACLERYYRRYRLTG